MASVQTSIIELSNRSLIGYIERAIFPCSVVRLILFFGRIRSFHCFQSCFVRSKASIMKMIYFFTILWTLAVSTFCEPVNEPPKLTILKCCRHMEELEKELDNDMDAKSRCVPTQFDWKPVIYSPSKQKMLATPPEEWNIVEGKKPDCKDNSVLTYVPYRHTNPFVIMDDGRVLPDIHVNDTFEPNEYCADSNALLVCMKNKMNGSHAANTMRPRVRQCCGENAAFYEEM